MDLDKTSLESEYWSDFHLFLNLVQFLETSLSHESTIGAFMVEMGPLTCSPKFVIKKERKKKCTLVTYWSLSSSPYVQRTHTHTHSESEEGSVVDDELYLLYLKINECFVQ